MSAKILDGRIVRDKIAQSLKLKIKNLKLKPALVIIQVGDNPESNTYINQKIKFGKKIGAIVELKKLPSGISQKSLISQISNLNSDNSVNGIILQIPIPDHLDKDKLIELIDPKKDIDGLTTTNQKLLEEGEIDYTLLSSHPHSPVILSDSEESQTTDYSSEFTLSATNVIQNDKGDKTFDNTAFIPATAKGVISILNYYNIPIKGKRATVVGRSKLVGAPVATLLRNLGATVTVGHSKTEDLAAIAKPADIIVIAVGKPNLITKDHVSPGQTIIDVGINVVEAKSQALPKARKLVGDVDFNSVSSVVSAITPVPGGIGPMTVASLFENLLEAYKQQTT